MQAKWQGLDMRLVYEDWSDALHEFTLEAINGAINIAKAAQHPPSQGEFVLLCKAQRGEPCHQNYLPKHYVVDKEKIPERMKDVWAALSKKVV